jgi:DNA repair protein RadC
MKRVDATGLTMVASLLGGERPDFVRAQALLERAGGVAALAEHDEVDLVALGLDGDAVARVAAAFSLALLGLAPPELPAAVCTPSDAYACVAPLLLGRRRERFVVVALDVKNRPLLRAVVAEGSLESCPVDLREVFRPALAAGGSGVLVGHNHPSGDPEPSALDLALTARLMASGELLGLPLVDHIVVGRIAGRGKPPCFVSLAERGYLDPLQRRRRRRSTVP